MRADVQGTSVPLRASAVPLIAEFAPWGLQATESWPIAVRKWTSGPADIDERFGWEGAGPGPADKSEGSVGPGRRLAGQKK